MNEDVVKIFESEFEFNAFMLQIANDYEKKYFRKFENNFYYIQNDEQLLEIAKTYKEYLENSDERAYKAKVKKIFANSPVVRFATEYEKKNAPEKKYKKFELFLMIILAILAFCYAIFFADVLTERVVLSMSGAFLLISPFLAIRAKILQFLGKK